MTKILILLVMIGFTSKVLAEDSKFFANRAFQEKRPLAFVLSPQTLPFVQEAMTKTQIQGRALVKAIRADSNLSNAVLNFDKLPETSKLAVLKKVFQIEVSVLGIIPPNLIFDKNTKKSTFFDFDPAYPSSGKVILNPDLLFKDPNPFAALLFLIHETRHSEQFQIAYGPKANMGNLGQVYRAAFTAQKIIFDNHIRVSFCDFLTLANEYEAFQFGNLVTDALTSRRANTADMGTWASQYYPSGELKINLIKLAQKVGQAKLLEAFNEIEKGQAPISQ